VLPTKKRLFVAGWEFLQLFKHFFVCLRESDTSSSEAGLPDGIFLNQKSKIGYILEGLGIDNVGILCGHFEYFKTIWYISWPFGIFSPVLVCCTKKNLATLIRSAFEVLLPLIQKRWNRS
jgi:hypothetical protein